MTLALPILALATALHLSPEQAIGTPVPAPPEGQKRINAVASDGDGYVAVWIRDGSVDFAAVSADGDVGATRTIFSAQNSDAVSACWTGSVYLLTWNSETDQGPAIWSATLSPDGTLRSGPSIVVRDAATQRDTLAAAGRHALVTYATTGTAPAIKGVLFDSAGNVIDADLPLPIGENANIPCVVSSGSELALVWRTSEPASSAYVTFHLQRVGQRGRFIGTPITMARVERADEYSVAFGGGMYALAVIEQHLIPPGFVRPRAVRITVDGNGNVTALPPVDMNGFEMNVLWNGSDFIASWMESTNTSSALMTLPFASQQPATAIARSKPGNSPRLATNGRSVFGAWNEDIGVPLGEQTPIFGAIFDTSVSAGATTFLVSSGWSRQYAPALASSGAESLLVWIDSVTISHGRLLGIRLARDGAPLDAAPFEIAPDALIEATPLVTFTGSAYLVVWDEPASPISGSTALWARRVGRDASLGAPVSIGVGSCSDAASNPAATLVVFGGIQVSGFRFDADARAIDVKPFTIGNGFAPKVATNGTDFLVAWDFGSDWWQGPSPGLIDVVGSRVTAGGNSDAFPIAIATGPKDQLVAGVGSDGRDYTVFYDIQHAPGDRLAAKRVLREGQLDGAGPEDDGTIVGTELLPVSIIRDDGGFRLIGNAGGRPQSLLVLHTDFKGSPNESFSIAAGNSGALAATGDTTFLLAYSRVLTEGQYAGTSRLFVRSGDSGGVRRSRPHVE